MSTREIAYNIIDNMTDEEVDSFIVLFGGLGYVPNEETKQAMLEADKIAYDPNVKAYTDVHKMFEEILDDDV